jgi:predicted RNA-binding protein with PIN domain
MPVIVDGHNLLWSLHKSHEAEGSISDVQLCRTLGQYLRLVGEKGEIVFDGIGPPDKSGFDNISNLEVEFSGLASDCDSIIEHKIRIDTAPKRLTVVSSDRRLRDAARARRANSVKSEVFWAELLKELSRRREKREPPQKRQGISESETDQWMELFGLNE